MSARSPFPCDLGVSLSFGVPSAANRQRQADSSKCVLVCEVSALCSGFIGIIACGPGRRGISGSTTRPEPGKDLLAGANQISAAQKFGGRFEPPSSCIPRSFKGEDLRMFITHSLKDLL